MSRTMLSSVNDAAQSVARASSSDHLADVGRAAEKKLDPKRYKKYAPHVACAVAAAAVAVALFSSPPLPPPPPPPRPRLPYASDPTRPHSFYGLAWWLPCCATYRTEGLTARPAAAPPAKKKRWRRTRTSPAIEGLRNSATYLRKARGRKAACPVHAQPFMDGIQALMPTFGAFGSAIHAAAAKDVEGNVKKLRRNGAPLVPLHTLIRDEVARHNATHPDSTAQAFVWLKRILNFMSHFFDTLDRHPDLELNGCLTRAYEAHLGPYHNVVFRQLAVVLMQVIPDRAAMLELFGVSTFAELRPHLAAWTHETYPLIAKIDAFYVSNRLQP